MNEQKNKHTIEHIKCYCLELSETKERFGNHYNVYKNDKIYRNAVVMCILQIGELVTHLSDDFKLTHNEMPWKEFKILRNIAAHNYGSFSPKRTWAIATYEVPPLLEFCNKILNQNENS